jgi:Gas vesicle synthesis protein GvpL/GvpF
MPDAITETMTSSLDALQGPFYLYCVGRASDALSDHLPNTPIEGAGAAFTLRHSDLIAVLSPESIERYPISRRNLLAHKSIVETVMKHTPVLPVRFNTVAPSLELVRKRLLGDKADDLKAKLTAVEGCVEFSVRATWSDQEQLIQRILEENPKIAELRDRLVAGAGHHERIRLGQMVENAILARRDRVGADLKAHLEPLVRDSSVGTLPEGVVANLSVLLPEQDLETVEDAIHDFDALNDLLTIRITGPLPPFTFSEMVVRWEDES